MKNPTFITSCLALILTVHTTMSIARQISQPSSTDDHAATTTSLENELQRRLGRAHTLQIAGSRLPDCSHACGSCKPCRLVMVSFACASLAEAETCPISYKCMCNNKSFPVP